MRHLIKILFFSFLFMGLIISCGKDDGPEPKKDEVAQETPKDVDGDDEDTDDVDETESETPSVEESNFITDNVIINGGTKIEGTPPTPNGMIDMDLSNATTSGVLDDGFTIPLLSDADAVGAYVQFRATDGAVSESYYDIVLSENQGESGKTKKGTRYSETVKSARFTAKTTDNELDIDLGVEIEPGEFCYIICIYDANGNISNPQEVCVTVNAFGGDDALVGTWNLLRYEDTADGQIDIDVIGEEECFVNNCETEEYSRLTFNADGTFKSMTRFINREQGSAYSGKFDEYVTEGKWSFPAGGNSDLVVVSYYYRHTDENGMQEEDTYLEGESEDVIVVEAENIEVTDTMLNITTQYDDDDDGVIDELSVQVYERL